MGRLAVRMAILAAASGALGLGYNAVIPHRIPFIPHATYWNPEIPKEWTVTFDEVAKVSNGEVEGILVDVRSDKLFAAGHIPFADSLPVAKLTKSATRPAELNYYSKGDFTILYCEGGACHDSLKAAKKLKEYGYTNLRVYGGGWSEWKKSGGEIETGSPNATTNKSAA